MRNIFYDTYRLYYYPKSGEYRRHAQLHAAVAHIARKTGMSKKTALRKIALYRRGSQK
jgi:hypothetical protein